MTRHEVQSEVVLTKDIYWRPCLDQAIEDFAERLRVAISREDDRNMVVTITDLAGGAPDNGVMREFLNHLLDLSIHVRIQHAEENR